MTVLLQPRTSASGITPTLEDARELARHGNLIPVYRDFLADMETPVSVYDKVTTGPYSFLLESVEGGERLARYSFIGTEPRVVARLRDGIATIHSAGNPTRTEPFSDPLAFIRDLIAPYKPVSLPDMPRFVGGVVGYLAYECARYFEKLPVPPRDDLRLPDAVMMLADTLVVFDHVKHRMRVLAHADLTAHGGDVDEAYRDALHRIEAIGKRLGSPGTLTPGRAPLTVPRGRVDDVPANVASTFTRHAYQDAVTRAREYVASGDIIQ
ncbi:MAG: anthranilate synthase component I, partial [Proteobacteria bacterium]|nr:anthranilate synthase component I [Pseudomonadota bacterium]